MTTLFKVFIYRSLPNCLFSIVVRIWNTILYLFPHICCSLYSNLTSSKVPFRLFPKWTIFTLPLNLVILHSESMLDKKGCHLILTNSSTFLRPGSQFTSLLLTQTHICRKGQTCFILAIYCTRYQVLHRHKAIYFSSRVLFTNPRQASFAFPARYN